MERRSATDAGTFPQKWAREESNPESSLCKSDVLTIVETFCRFPLGLRVFCREAKRRIFFAEAKKDVASVPIWSEQKGHSTTGPVRPEYLRLQKH